MYDDEPAKAREVMVDAARQWLDVEVRDKAAVDRYFDHWLFGVLGYEGPSAE